jgi:aryl-alcohol dehydrogenase-like predicted oxidoreductase
MEYISWRENEIPSMVLGTAQLGSDYGIANTDGMPSPRSAYQIVKTSIQNGITCFDTAQAYGESERVLGDALSSFLPYHDIKVISKLSPDLDPLDKDKISQSIEQSCQNLKTNIWGLMLHDDRWLEVWDNGLGNAINEAKDKGIVKYVGVSVYQCDMAQKAIRLPYIDFIQVPCNAWDQRVIKSKVLDLARKHDKLCFVRSIYLQGLLLLSQEDVRNKVSIASDAARQWDMLVKKIGVSKKELCFSFALSLGCPIVVGVETEEQLEDNIKMCKADKLSKGMIEYIRHEMYPWLSCHVWNPKFWNKT